VIMFPPTAAKPVPQSQPRPPRPAADYGPDTPAAKAVAKRLDKHAERGEFAGRARQLLSLAAALRDPAEARLWRGVPVHDAFAGLAPEPDTRSASVVVQALNVLRAVAVFLPLLVSWMGIHGAVAAYGEQLDSDPDQGAQAFFREWLSGFDGALWLSFDRMALIVVVCIVGLIAVSIAAESFQRFADAAADRAANGLRDQLDYDLTEAALHLRALPSDNPEDVERRLAEATTRSADLIEALHETVTAVRGELDALDASAGEFRTVVAGLENGAKEIAASTARLDATISAEQGRAAQTFADAGTAVAAEIAASAGELRTGTDALQQQALDMLAQLGQAMGEAVSQGERNRDALGLLMRDNRDDDARALADAIAQRQTELADELRSAGRDIAAQLHDTVRIDVDQPLRAQLDGIQQSHQQLGAALGALSQTIAHLAQQQGLQQAPQQGLVPIDPLQPQPKRRWFWR
jgi:prefoldin subunit 5